MRKRVPSKAILAMAWLLSLPGPAMAAEGASLEPAASPTRLAWEDAIKAAVEGHPLIKAARHGVQETDAVGGQIAAVNYPQVSGILSNSLGNTRVQTNLGISGSLPKPTNYLTSPGLRVDFLITDFGRTAHKILANRQLTAAAEKQVLTAKALVILNVEQAYLTCLKLQQLSAITKEVMTERRLIRDQAAAMHRSQLRSKLDLEMATVEAAKAEVDFIKAQNDLQTAFGALNRAMGRQGVTPYALEEIRPSISPAAPLDPLVTEALARRPELLGSRDRAKAAEEALKAARALHYGTVSATGATGYGWWARQEVTSPRGNPNNPGAQQGWWGAGFASSHPLYTGQRIEAEIEQAEAGQDEALAVTRIVANDVALEVARAYLSRLTADQQIAVAQDRLAQAREALTLARERYKAGLASILDVTVATAGLLRAETELADARYGYLASDSALSYATGASYAKY